MLVYLDGLYLKHLAKIEQKVKRQLLDQIRWDNARLPLTGDRYERPSVIAQGRPRRKRPSSAKSSATAKTFSTVKTSSTRRTTSTRTSKSTKRDGSRQRSPKRKPRSVHVDWGHQAKSVAVDLGENPRSFTIGVGPLNPEEGRRSRPRTAEGKGGGVRVEQQDGTNVLVESGEGPRRGTTNVEINKGKEGKDGGTKIRIDSAGRDRAKGSTSVSIKKSGKAKTESVKKGTDIKVKSHGKDILIKNSGDKRHSKESTKIDIKHGSKYDVESKETTLIDIQRDSSDEESTGIDYSRERKSRRRGSKDRRQRTARERPKSSKSSTSVEIKESSGEETLEEEVIRNGRQSRFDERSKRNTSVQIDFSDDESSENDSTSDSKTSTASKSSVIRRHDRSENDRGKHDNDRIKHDKYSMTVGTQTSWMDTDPDPPPPILQHSPKKSTESKDVRRIKFFGEKTYHYEYEKNYVETKERDGDDLVVSVTEPAEPEPLWREKPQKVKPEVVHYIDYDQPQNSLDMYEPVFVKPSPMPKHVPRRPVVTHPLVKVGGGWMRPSDYQHSRIPLEVHQHEQPFSKNKYLVIKSRPAPKPEPSPIYYRQFEKHTSTWPMYYPVKQAWGY